MYIEGGRKGLVKRLIVFVVAICVLLIAVIIFSLGYVLTISLSGKLERGVSSEPNIYRYTSGDRSTMETSSGLISLKDDLGNDEYLFGKDGFKSILISNFGVPEYECTGTCTCSKDVDNERRIAATSTRPLYYLLAAATSFVAIKLANDHFKEECVNLMAEDEKCKGFDISSLLDSCQRVDTFEKSTDSNEYVCEGNCINRSMMNPKYYGTHLNFNMVLIEQFKAFKKSGGCKRLKIRSVVKVPWTLYRGDTCTEEDAINYFIDRRLTSFCVNEPSSIIYWDDQETGKPMNINICLGAGEYNVNPSVKCRKVLGQKNDDPVGK